MGHQWRFAEGPFETDRGTALAFDDLTEPMPSRFYFRKHWSLLVAAFLSQGTWTFVDLSILEFLMKEVPLLSGTMGFSTGLSSSILFLAKAH